MLLRYLSSTFNGVEGELFYFLPTFCFNTFFSSTVGQLGVLDGKESIQTRMIIAGVTLVVVVLFVITGMVVLYLRR